jgi:hypothetical protein
MGPRTRTRRAVPIVNSISTASTSGAGADASGAEGRGASWIGINRGPDDTRRRLEEAARDATRASRVSFHRQNPNVPLRRPCWAHNAAWLSPLCRWASTCCRQYARRSDPGRALGRLVDTSPPPRLSLRRRSCGRSLPDGRWGSPDACRAPHRVRPRTARTVSGQGPGLPPELWRPTHDRVRRPPG